MKLHIEDGGESGEYWWDIRDENDQLIAVVFDPEQAQVVLNVLEMFLTNIETRKRTPSE